MLYKIWLLALGGGLGAMSRYGATMLSARVYNNAFPWGTLVVNLVGCFLIGLVFALVDHRGVLSHDFRLFFVTGFLGALTTFSTFGLESVNFFREGDWLTAGTNVLVHNVCGLVLVFAGIWVGRSI